MKNMYAEKFFFLLTLLMIAIGSFAQDDTPAGSDQPFTVDAPLTIDFEEEEEEEAVAPKKKKRKKKVFYGIKTKKAFTKRGFGEKTVLELFHILKEYEEPDPYVRDIYWLDFRKRQIRVGGEIDKKYGAILHGPYVMKQGDQILEEGIFYKGAKHGRWTKLSKNDILLDKQKYFKGWPKESLVRYYDSERTKIKEVIPVEYGEKEGNYYYFFENGLVAVKGEYKYDQKVGRWTEHHYNTIMRKKIIQYRTDPYDEQFEPYVWREYSNRGKVIYDKDVDSED